MVARRRRPGSTEPAAPSELISDIRSLSRPLRNPRDLDPLLDRIGDARYVLLGEASHGTHEYYTWRAEISKRLITEKAFRFIAVEGDWPDCYRVNRYVKGIPDSGDNAREVLHAYERWPTWMWANEEIVAFAEWLRECNDDLPSERKVGFYGLDVYSLWDSLYQVLGYVRKNVPGSVSAARAAFRCFEPFGENAVDYAKSTRWTDESCEDEVVELLGELRRSAKSSAQGREAHFEAEQNALVVKNAEHYYRTMVRGGPESWNIRDRHMTETLERLMEHHGPDARAIVWAHNTHIGDARYTDMADDDMINIGELVREVHAPEGVVLVGFSSQRGSVIAGDEWEAPMERMNVPAARRHSWEDVLHRAGAQNKLLLLDQVRKSDIFLEPRGHRAIGVVYHPAYESYGNYVPTVLPMRYDAFLYFDETRGLEPLHDVKIGHDGEVPETYPTGV